MALVDYSVKTSQRLERTGQRASVLIAIPAFNEEPTIGSVVLKARRFGHDVVVVDDGSTDDTAQIAEEAGATVVRHQTNRGYGAALRSCFGHARANGASMLVILDGDGQHDPSAIPTVLDPIIQGRADVSIGSRFLRGTSSTGIPRYRRFGIGFLTRLTNLGTKNGTKLHDAQSGFRAYSRKAIEVIDPREEHMGASTEIIWDANRNGLRIEEVPIRVIYPENRSARGPVRHAFSVMGSMLVYIETKHALLTFGVPGLALFSAGIGFGLSVLKIYHDTGMLAVGLSLVTVIMLVVGMLLGFTGLILHAVINATRRLG